MLALFNFNTYLGGGETLFVRMAEYLNERGEDFLLFYHSDSYIEKDLDRIGISNNYRVSFKGDANYYYLRKRQREQFVTFVVERLPRNQRCDLLSFCARETFLLADVSKANENVKVSHLVLHGQDNLYACQSIFDKISERITRKRIFGRKNMIRFNASLFNELATKGALIPMSELGAKLWKESYGINVRLEDVVPLPSFNFEKLKPITSFSKKILWIGRIVNFKIPSILVALNFLKRHPDYTLTIIGYGEEDFLHNYIRSNNINEAQVCFLGKVDYSKLREIILQHGIGYAMGTSIIELARYGLPVIMALSSLSYRNFSRDICGGLFYNASKGDVGSAFNMNPDESAFPTLDDSVAHVEAHYEDDAQQTYDYIKNLYDINSGIKRYLELINRQGNGGRLNTKIPFCSPLRRLLFNSLSKK